MPRTKRRVQILLLVGLAIMAAQPGVLAWMSCAEFTQFAWTSANEACQATQGTGILSQECECYEDGQGNMVDGICFALCEPLE